MKYTNNTIRINLFFILVIVLLFCAIFAKLAYVALNDNVEGTDLKTLAENRSTATKTITASRGNIYDKNGDTLAQNVNSYTVIAYLSEKRTTDSRYPKHVVDKKTTAEELAKILEPLNSKMTKDYILTLLNKDAYQVELGPGGRNISELTKNAIEELALPGIDFVATTKRYYPYGDFASYIIGYAKKYDDELKGELGIEGYVNSYLTGKDGTITYQKDAYGYQLALSDKYTYKVDAQDGYDVYLTLDAQIQQFLENAVSEFEEYDTDWVTFTIADAKTGAILGSATSPSYNPNKLNITNYQNPLISYTYEPGSTMKIFSFMSGIEEGTYDGSATYKSGTLKVADYTIKDWNRVGWGTITYDTGFTYSSNVAAIKVATKVGKAKLKNYYDKLGFGSLTNIELANEAKGEVDFEYDVEFAAASYGQGITVTPIQMIQALTTITNDGTTMQPYIIDKIVDPDTGEVKYQGKKKELNKVYSTSTVNKMIDLMDKTVNGSDKAATGKVYSTDAVRLIGKTGTANYSNGSGKYVTGSYNNIRSFAGVFPKDDPKYIIYVAVKDLHGTSKNMGKIVKETVESISKYSNIDERVSANKDESKIITVPLFVNKTTTYAESKLKVLGADYVVIGDGNRIISQYPNKDSKISNTTKVFLLTNGTTYKMPDMTGWSSGEVRNFCDAIGLKYTIEGYGYVVSTNKKENDIIDLSDTLEVTLESIKPGSLIPETEEELEDGKEESEETTT